MTRKPTQAQKDRVFRAAMRFAKLANEYREHYRIGSAGKADAAERELIKACAAARGKR